MVPFYNPASSISSLKPRSRLHISYLSYRYKKSRVNVKTSIRQFLRASGGIRTPATRYRKPLLYPLSYKRISNSRNKRILAHSTANVKLLYKLFENADRIVTREACVRDCMRFRRQQV